LSRELTSVGEYLPSVDTIFIGGGTPTIFEENLFETMLRTVATSIPRSSSYEWTIEANPETVTKQKAEMMNDLGVNRVSIGAQTFDPSLLKTLERWHEVQSVEQAIHRVREAGIKNINLDLIYAIPTQTESQLRFDLNRAIALKPTHLSCYSLTYELGTPLRTRLERGDVQRVEHELESVMFNIVCDELKQEGYAQYEISNFATLGYECAHNIAYWTNQSWWPIGPSASGHINGKRWKNIASISQYIGGNSLPNVTDVETLSPDRSAGESFMLGLRMRKGMEKSWVNRLIEQSNNGWREDVLNRYIQEGFLHWENGYLTLTTEGICFADTVISSLLMQDVTITDT
jgi:oxygen-independent coproporphyrinogen-3 oxidase